MASIQNSTNKYSAWRSTETISALASQVTIEILPSWEATIASIVLVEHKLGSRLVSCPTQLGKRFRFRSATILKRLAHKDSLRHRLRSLLNFCSEGYQVKVPRNYGCSINCCALCDELSLIIKRPRSKISRSRPSRAVRSSRSIAVFIDPRYL